MYYLWYIVKSAFIDWWRYEIMEFWRFIFSSFWVWLGFAILLSMVGGGIIELVKACKRKRKVTGYRIDGRWHIEIEDASAADVQQAIVSAAYEPWRGREKKGDEQEKRGDRQ